MDKAGQIIDGSAFAEKIIASYRNADIQINEVQNRDGDRSVIIILSGFPMMKLRGAPPDEKGDFYLTSLEYLGGSAHGWNEYTLDLLGAGSLTLGSNAVFSIDDDIETVQISAGRIQRYDTRLTGGEALTNLRNRRERIAAVTEWLFVNSDAHAQSIEDFERQLKPFLFPEITGKKLRPEGWMQEGDVFIKAEDISWNTGYTERVLPAELRDLRNSGALLRDWEDALSWIYLEYKWESIKELLSRRTTLVKIK